MLNKRMSEDLIININNVSYKFKKVTVIAIDKAIDHIKKYKKVYKGLVVYIALCLSPYLYDLGASLIFELMHSLATQSLDLVMRFCIDVIVNITKKLTILIVTINAVTTFATSVYENYKNKY